MVQGRQVKETSNIGESVTAMREAAHFLDQLFHHLKDSDRRHGRDLVQVARKNRLPIPPVLDGYKITYSTRPISKKDVRRVVVIQLPPRPAPPVVTKLSFNGCADFSTTKGGVTVSGKVCINCTVSLGGASCTLTVTATISV